MRRLWSRLADDYGAARWEREYGSEPSKEWTAALAGCTLDDIARGIGIARRDDSGRIPTPGIFRAWCRLYPPGSFSGAAAPSHADALRKRLASGASGSEMGRRWLAFMRLYRLAGDAPLTEREIDEIDDAIGDADLEAMRREVIAATPSDARDLVQARLRKGGNDK